VEVSLPQYFALPNKVTIPTKEDASIPWQNPAGTHTYNLSMSYDVMQNNNSLTGVIEEKSDSLSI